MAAPLSSARRERGHYLPADVVQDAQARLSRLVGHVRAVGRMLAERRDCADLLMQLMAVLAGLTQVTVRLTQAHVEACLSMVRTPEDHKRAIARLEAALAVAVGQGHAPHLTHSLKAGRMRPMP
ncbi:MAG: metal-sensitive transcriptional regulator [Chloroflexi bacterium]|nr:metal-sensitive transcriptional regulator [Chloroflexota bacterium]